MTEGAKPDRASGYAMRGLQGRVIDGVGRAVIRGDYPPGGLVPKEVDLTVQYGVSRTSVREAMRVLAAKGLVDIRQKIGTRVREPQRWNVFDADILRWHDDEGLGESILRDLVDVRETMEPQAARLAAARATAEDIECLRAAVARMAAAVDDRVAFAAADVEFHQAVYAASHNVLMRQFGAVLADVMLRSFSMQLEMTSDGDYSADVERHAAVVRAIERRRAERAAGAMLAVVLDAKSALLAALTTEPMDVAG
jgi:DNA-binding FadR family transcriptional regulator